MKEFSIEEKAKAYDEIIKKANKMHHENCEACQICIEELIPELCESEDERIIKAIKSAVLQLTDIYLQEKYGLNQSDCIAWLEKQGETFTKKDVDDAYIKGICDAKHEFEKQGEQKPADKVEQKFKVGDKVLVDGKVYTIKLVNEDNYIVDENGRDVQEHFSYTKDWKLYEQKSTWSEEDEMRFNIIFKYLEGLPLSQNWLKSLGDRVKDNELTWEDIPEIFRISEQLKTSWWFMDNEQTKLIGTQVFWEEVLKRFKEKKGNNYDNCKDKER